MGLNLPKKPKPEEIWIKDQNRFPMTFAAFRDLNRGILRKSELDYIQNMPIGESYWFHMIEIKRVPPPQKETEVDEGTGTGGGGSVGAFEGPFMNPIRRKINEGLNLPKKSKSNEPMFVVFDTENDTDPVILDYDGLYKTAKSFRDGEEAPDIFPLKNLYGIKTYLEFLLFRVFQINSNDVLGKKYVVYQDVNALEDKLYFFTEDELIDFAKKEQVDSYWTNPINDVQGAIDMLVDFGYDIRLLPQTDLQEGLNLVKKSKSNPWYYLQLNNTGPGIKVKTIDDAVRMVNNYCDTYNLGASQFSGGRVFDINRNFVARISYNGRIWAEREYKMGGPNVELDYNLQPITTNINEQKLNMGSLKLMEILTPADIQQIKSIAAGEAKSEANRVKNDLSKDITDVKKKQTDVGKTIDKHIQDKDQHTTEKQSTEAIKTEIDKLKQDTDKKIDDKIDKALDGKDLDKKMRELVADTMVKYHQTLWVKRGFWTGGLTK